MSDDDKKAPPTEEPASNQEPLKPPEADANPEASKDTDLVPKEEELPVNDKEEPNEPTQKESTKEKEIEKPPSVKVQDGGKVKRWITSTKKFTYDSKTKRFCGRTCRSWGEILGFYTVFYFVVFGLTAVMLLVSVENMPKHQPRLLGNGTFVGAFPGLKAYPVTKSKNPSKEPFVLSDDKDPSVAQVATELAKQMEEKIATAAMGRQCGFKANKNSIGYCEMIGNDNQCEKEAYGACAVGELNSTYQKVGNFRAACILVQINRLIAWEPRASDLEFVDTTNYSDPNEGNAIKLCSHNTESDAAVRKDACWDQRINLHCETFDGAVPEVGAAAKPELAAVSVYPKYGIPSCYFPYQGNLIHWRSNGQHYESPYFMVHLANMSTKADCDKIGLRCWLGNRSPEESREDATSFFSSVYATCGAGKGSVSMMVTMMIPFMVFYFVK